MANEKVKLPEYGPDSLRPNPEAADPSMGVLAFSVPPTLMGIFGANEGSSARVTNGLPKGNDKAGKRRQ